MIVAQALRSSALLFALALSNLVPFRATADAQENTPLVPGLLTTRQPAVAYGPYNGRFLEGGLGLTKPLHEHEPLSTAQRGWSMSLWYKSSEPEQTALLAGIGKPGEDFPRYLALRHGRPAFWAGRGGEGHELQGRAALAAGVWHSVAISVDNEGKASLFADGAEVAAGMLELGPASDVLELAPARAASLGPSLGNTLAPDETPWWPGPEPDPASTTGPRSKHFGGLLAQVSLSSSPLDRQAVSLMAVAPTGLDNLPFEEGSRSWPVQISGPAGTYAPQDPSLLPHSLAQASAPKSIPPASGEDVATADGSTLLLRHGWQLADASTVTVAGPELAKQTFATSGTGGWMAAVVPGTVLTTMIARGIYPDPDFGLDNMAIPEALSKHSFWYRNVFTLPSSMRGRHLAITFHGINYHAMIFLNGSNVGEVVGAFRHQQFDVTTLLKPGEKNVLAVLIAPPPHGGIAHEQSLAAGAGDNGGVMMLDGPTFGATEGWDWIPGIRDRNMGIWQDVAVTAHGAVEIEVPQIITHLTDPDPSAAKAEITVRVPLVNDSHAAVRGTVEIDFDDVYAAKAITVPPGGMTVELAPADFPQLSVQHPKLWWPNGYGDPALHTMKIGFKSGGRVSDSREDRFGIREITYELSAFDSTGHVRRVEASPTAAELLGKGAVIEQTHEGFRETPDGWVPTIVPGMENSPALRPDADLKMGTAMVIKVNGVRIAVKGGSWGMDDMLKRVSRERLEPFFRLHKEANVNMIRNWMGQDTERRLLRSRG